MSESNAFEKHIDTLISQYKKQLDSIKKTREDVLNNSFQKNEMDLNDYQYNCNLKTHESMKNDMSMNNTSKNVYIDNLIESKKEIVDLRTKLDSLEKENIYLSSRKEIDLNEINKFKEANEKLIIEIQKLEKEKMNLKEAENRLNVFEKEMQVLYENHQNEMNRKNSEVEKMKNSVEILNQEARIRDQIVEIVINFLNRNVNSNTNANLFIDLNQAISLLKVEAMISNIENYYSKLKVNETGNENHENLFEKVQTLLDENNRIESANKNYKLKIADLEEKLAQIKNENICFIKENNFFREKNNLLNENDEDNLNISRNMKSPLTNKNISSSFLYNKKDMSFNNKLNKYDHYGKEISINDNIRSYNSNERDNRVKNSFISYNPNNNFQKVEAFNMSPLKNIKTKLRDIEKRIVSMKDNKERNIIDSLKEYRNNNIRKIFNKND